MMHHWCKMQGRVALSSGEAELKAACKCIAELLEVREALSFITGAQAKMSLHLDAQATEGMLKRQGSGRLKHLTVRTLWVQAAVLEYKVEVVKIPRSLNHADALCSFHGSPDFHAKILAMGCRVSPPGPRRRRGGDDGQPTAYQLDEASTRRQHRRRQLLMLLTHLDQEE